MIRSYKDKKILYGFLRVMQKHPRLAVIFIIICSVTAILSSNESSIKGDIRVVDGDTIVLNNVKIRLQGTDSPETQQYCETEDKNTKIPCGKMATEKLKEIIGNNKVTCNIKGTDRYKRKLGYCYAGEININKEMVKRGYAVAYVKYDKSFLSEEIEAKRLKLGFWNGKFENPEIWRKKNKRRLK